MTAYRGQGGFSPYVPGAGQGAPISGRAAGTPGIGGAIRANVKRVVLARVNTSGTSRPTASVAARIVNPAARLVCSFSITFEPDSPQDFSNYNSSTWTARVFRVGEEGREAALHFLFSAQALPEMYEISSAARVVVLTATLAIPQTAAPAPIAGRWICEAQWEPAMPMCEEEISALYSQTGLSVALAPVGPLAP